MNIFSIVVSLYRSCGRPAINGGVFRYEGAPNSQIFDLAELCRGLDARHGSLIDCYENAGVLTVEFRVPRSSDGAFYFSFAEYVRSARTLGKGVASENFYIVSVDWAPFDRDGNLNFDRIKGVCALITNLSSLANWIDDKSNDSYMSLYFSLPADKDKPPRNVVISTKFSEDMLAVELRFNGLVAELVSDKNRDKLHIAERKLIFGMALADMAERCPQGEETFSFIVSNWAGVVSLYRHSLQAYLYGFSFDKVRGEVAKAEIEFAGKLSSVLGDISGKLLALPVSIAGVVALNKFKLGLEFYSGVLGVFLVSAILLMVVWNQWLQVDRLKHSFDIVFGQFKGKIGSYPKPLREALQKSIGQVSSQVAFLDFTFGFFMLLATTPIFCSLALWDSKNDWQCLFWGIDLLKFSWDIPSRALARIFG
ncbi:hypothetical protein [Pseudomonas sp. S12(2018)]|uniref:hypothetical protein n=1 Tax=Pseudomonas sp. S12(2018) TaxID=2219664 RepID=UPI0020CD4503|nr:hypothetical protein [Pseudomonas sp. S12(2018)]